MFYLCNLTEKNNTLSDLYTTKILFPKTRHCAETLPVLNSIQERGNLPNRTNGKTFLSCIKTLF